jgi:DNA-binding CsgD family transcriptional regulator
MTATGVDDVDVFRHLDSLVRKSLLVADHTTTRTRHSLFETIRQFAEDRLAETGALEPTRDRHAAYFAGESAARWEHWNGPAWRDAVNWVEAELGDLRSGYQWSAGRGDLSDAAVHARQQLDAALRDPRPRGRQARPGGLSPREIEVLRLVADGRTAGDIATQLFISSRTVEHHIEHIYTKIGVSSRAAATRWAVKHQVVDGIGGR